MINFLFKKSSIKDNNKLTLKDKFPWLNIIDNQLDDLIDQDINIRINEIINLNNFFLSLEGKQKLNLLKSSSVTLGYPKTAADLEIDLLVQIFKKDTLDKLLFNPCGGLHIHKNNEKFNSDKSISDNFGILRSPKGKIFIVGSSNTLLPVMTAMILSYILGNITVVQLSSLHLNIIPNLISSLPSNSYKYIHFTKLNRSIEEDQNYLSSLLISVNWNVVNLWGGNESLSYYFGHLLKNSYRPRIVSMEPMTGIVLIQNSFIKENKKFIAKELAYSIFVMGQQLCSSPTIGFVISEDINFCLEELSREIILEIEKLYIQNNNDESKSIMLDRMLNVATDNGSRVHLSNKYKNNISVIESLKHSVFAENKIRCFLDIHERRNFIELIKVKNFNDAINQLRLLPTQYSYKEIQKVQTILPFGDKKFLKHVFNLAKKIGAYRIISSEFTLVRHPMEPLDSYNLINEFTNQIAVSGINSQEINILKSPSLD